MRTVWEAADLGVLIWRTKLFALLALFSMPAALVSVLLMALFEASALPAFMREHQFASVLAVHWWLKPFYGRFALHVCAKAFFKQSVRPRALFLELPNLLRALPGDLLWRRFSPVRGVMLPLRVLEHCGKNYRLRRETLARGGILSGAYITVFCLALTIVLCAGMFLFLYAAEEMGARTLFLLEGLEWPAEALIFALLSVNVILTETLYIAMSFALYINSRVITEGWDLQLEFHRLAELYEASH
ncbi:MAG: hypothetical protein LBC77_08840 [Spirochaetaceae bacterium]|nr:hypothetical protein [Spirochaetaceae bacterium]